MNTKAVRFMLPLAALLLAAPAMAADIVLYQQDFNGYSDGTNLATVPGWYQWGGAVATIQNGQAQATADTGYNATDMLLSFPALFSHNNTQARIEFDARLSYVTDFLVGPGTASNLDFNYNQFAGFENGATYNGGNLLFTSAAGGFDQSTQNYTADSAASERHYVLNFTLDTATNVVTWSGTYDGTKNLIGGGKTSLSFGLTDPRGLNTIEWTPTAFSNQPACGVLNTLDNLLVVDVTAGPSWPGYLPGDFNKDGQVGPEDFGILKDQFGVSALPHGNHESWTLGDANDDGQIGPEDFGLLKDNFGASNGPTGTYPLSNVPEPTTLTLLALGGILAARKNRR